MRFRLVFVFLLFSLTNCQKGKICFEKDDKLIIKKCIDKILETSEGKQVKDCYLVRPYLDTLSLTSYSKEENKILLDNINFNNEELLTIRKDTVLKCQNSYIEVLADLSICDESYTIFSTTKIYDNLVQIRLVDHYESIDINQIRDKFAIRPNQIFEYIFIIRRNGEVDVLLQNDVFYD